MHPFTLRIAIPTYNRPKMLKRLTDDIARRAPRANVIIYDDGSIPPARVRRAGIVRLRHGGKRGFWALMNHLFSDARRARWNRLLVLPDDVSLAPDFFDRIETLWMSIPCPQKMLLNPIMDERGACRQWTPLEPERASDALWRVGWNDCAFYTDRRFVNLFKGFRRPPAARWQRPMISSGVGEQLSQWAFRYGYSLWQSADALALHGPHPSQMHPRRSHNL